MRETNVPVVTIDGPSGSGKGTVAALLAKEFDWHLLDSGALYRLTALAAMNHDVDFSDEKSLEVLAGHLDVQFEPGGEGETLKIILEGERVGANLRTEEVGAKASQIAALPGVRKALLQRQQDFAEAPGLVADGRDMGTVVFPQANVKVYLTASAEERAKRRQNQLQQKGIDASFDQLLGDIIARDDRDMNRDVAPLKPADDAIVLDSTRLSIQEVFSRVVDVMRQNGLI
ncbi:(d)CMP kinase [Endozoicomonas numazuensis]|uniref:Cytidylate kinase n=1 Tax=Endozoicomonas numazuensis TaxID=1137799 RepID=A0A081NH34_9GAMM|nr:(d)CMP kinase [Endozoicomonas numazuensis]KEQ17757.1 cytidylate kinase [Endozoicomonas numazuensis]